MVRTDLARMPKFDRCIALVFRLYRRSAIGDRRSAIGENYLNFFVIVRSCLFMGTTDKIDVASDNKFRDAEKKARVCSVRQ